MAGQGGGVVGQGVEAPADRVGQCGVVRAGEVVAADGSGEEGVADDGGAGGFVDEGDSPRGVARGVEHLPGLGDEGEGFAVFEKTVGVGGGDLEASPGGQVEHRVRQPLFLGPVDPDGGVREAGAEGEEAGDVVEMGVGQDDNLGLEAQVLDLVEHGVGVEAAVGDPAGIAGLRVRPGDHEAVGLEWSEGENADFRLMIGFRWNLSHAAW